MKPIAVLTALFFYILVGNATADSSFSPLIKAVTNKNASPFAIDSLLKNGADANVKDSDGRSALMLAAMHNPDPLAVYTLIHFGARVNERETTSGKTALFFAVQYNPNPEVIMTLLNNGADQDITDFLGRTADDYADRNPKIKENPVLWLFHKYQPKDEDVEEDTSSDSAASL